jgi:hypothetical protein
MEREEVNVVHVGVYIEADKPLRREGVFMQDTEGRVIGTTQIMNQVIFHPVDFVSTIMKNLNPVKGLELVIVHPGNVKDSSNESQPLYDRETLRTIVDGMIKAGNYEVGVTLNTTPIDLPYRNR